MERAELARLLHARVARNQAGVGPHETGARRDRTDHESGDGAVAEARDVVVVEEREPTRFCATFADAVATGGTVFLANPDWGAAERAQFNALVATSAQRPTEPNAKSQTPASALRTPHSAFSDGWLCIPTGGSAGRIKLARHDQDTLHAAVRGFCAHFAVEQVNVVNVLPLHHVGGLMSWLRAELTGGEFLTGDWKAIEAGVLPVRPSVTTASGATATTRRRAGWFLSLVPTQLQRLLARPAAVEWLREFSAVLVGGGPAWEELAEAGARVGLPLAFSYGATETAAAMAVLRPEEFLAGGRGCGSALPHLRVTVDAEGALAVEGESLFRGYWPEWRETDAAAERGTGASATLRAGAWPTGDTGFFDEHGSLRITGRRDALIITGGEKVAPGEVEAALRATGEFADVAVVGVPDAEWGNVVVACYPAATESEHGGMKAPDAQKQPPPNWARVATGLERLAAWKRPKRFVALVAWPRDAAGKVNRTALVQALVDRERQPM